MDVFYESHPVHNRDPNTSAHYGLCVLETEHHENLLDISV